MARRIVITAKHDLGYDAARERMEALVDYFRNKYRATIRWEGSQCWIDARYLLVKIDVHAEVAEDYVHLDGRDPGVLLRNRATSYLERKVATYLDPSTPVSELPRG